MNDHQQKIHETILTEFRFPLEDLVELYSGHFYECETSGSQQHNRHGFKKMTEIILENLFQKLYCLEMERLHDLEKANRKNELATDSQQ